MANRGTIAASGPRYCAEHRHDIPSFPKLRDHFESLDDADSWLTFERRNAARATRIVVVTGTVGAALIAPVALAGAPMIGGATGALSGYSGAAATSHGLAVWGGGSIASGGLGMAGGTAVITAVGSGLGGALGGVATAAYVRSDKSFRIEKLRDGCGPAVLLASGFLTQARDGWDDWQPIIDRRYPDNPVYRAHWGAKELGAVAALMGSGGAKQAAQRVLRSTAAKASKRTAGVPGLGGLLIASDLAKNPWSVALNRAGMTGAVLADLISRTEDQQFILVGHSLGARVMVTAAQALGTRHATPKVHTIHLLGAAVGTNGDWRTLHTAVSDIVWNYYSQNDQVLRVFYRAAQGGQRAVGHVGFRSKFAKIRDRNVSRQALGHSGYFSGVILQ